MWVLCDDRHISSRATDISSAGRIYERTFLPLAAFTNGEAATTSTNTSEVGPIWCALSGTVRFFGEVFGGGAQYQVEEAAKRLGGEKTCA
jgi:hypothetical protein